MPEMLLYWLILINFVAFCLYGWDKHLARQQKRRVPERTLLLVAVPGGALGALLGMVLFHHKTKKPKFVFTVPLLLLAQGALLFFLHHQNLWPK